MALIGRVFSDIRSSRHVTGFYGSVKEIHTTSVTQLNQSWRQKKRLPENPNAFGPLTNLPDYSYVDGRPTPFGTRMLDRINRQREILKTVRKLTGQIDHAVQRHQRIQIENYEIRERILKSKLKAKGQTLAIKETSDKGSAQISDKEPPKVTQS